MDICRLDTPVVKRIPQQQQSAFATAWGRLLRDAVASQRLSDWSDFFIFPKCILWSPVRGGKRLAKKAKFVEAVRDRLRRWPSDREGLWKEVVQRSTRVRDPPAPRKPSDKDRTESAAVAALRLGDVRKALQLLNSAPIAPKTQATLALLRKLHPKGEKPDPVAPGAQVPYITVDVVRASLSTFGPASAAGLFGYRPLGCSSVHAQSLSRGRTP
jgi:hypothetical protein